VTSLSFFATIFRHLLFDATLAARLAPFRRFRHVVHHGYSFQLDWERMQEGIAGIELVFTQFNVTLTAYLQSLNAE
jgi:hypothetical protein